MIVISLFISFEAIEARRTNLMRARAIDAMEIVKRARIVRPDVTTDDKRLGAAPDVRFDL